MAKKFTQNDLYQDDIYGNLRESLEKTLAVFKSAEKSLSKQVKSFSKIASMAGNSAKTLGKLTDANKRQKKAVDERQKAADRIVRTEKELERVTSLQRKTLASLSLEKRKANQIAKEQAILESRLTSEFDKEKVRLKQLEREYRDLLLLKGKDAKETRMVAKQHERLSKRLDQVNRAVNRNKSGLKTYGAALGRVSSAMRTFGGTLLAFVGARQVVSFFKSSIEAFQTQAKAVAKVEQAITSTGGAAGRSAKQLQEMASALQENTLFGDEEILNKVTAQLLTFTNITGEQFDRTQKVALDLATVLDGDLQSASIQLGKALNDPVANLSALSRSGIQFSTEQKDLIKTLAETGKLAEAQAVILDELERQYGGQAAAAAEADGGIQQLRNTFGDLMEVIGGELLAAIKPSIKNLKELIQGLDEDRVKGFAKRIGEFVAFFIDNLPTILKLLGKFLAFWTSYKIAMQAATVVSNLFGKSLANLKKSLGIFGVALVAAFEIFKAFKAQWEEANIIQNKWADLQDEVNSKLDEEKVKLFKLRDELFKTNAGSEERLGIIKRINKEYGTTLRNLEDEESFIRQISDAYVDYVENLERKITLQAVEDELVEVQKKILETQRAVDQGLGEVFGSTGGKTPVEEQLESLETYKSQLLQTQIFLEKTTTETAGRITKTAEETANELDETAQKSDKKTIDREKEKLDKLVALKKKHTEELLALENRLIEEGVDEELRNQILFEKEVQQRREQGRLIEELDFENTQILLQHRNDYLKFVENGENDRVDLIKEANLEIAKNEEELTQKIKKENEDRWKDFQDVFERVNELAKDAADFQIMEIERQQEVARENVQQSQSEQARLRELGTKEAAEALIAEEKREAREKRRIDSLERRKRDLLITIVALERANQLIQSGQGNPFSKSTADISQFLSDIGSFPGFFEGTNTDVADALGSPNLNTSKDNYLIRVHGTEPIMNGKQYGDITRAFGYKPTTDEMTRHLIMNANRVKYGLPLQEFQSNNAMNEAIEKVGDKFEQAFKKHLKTTEIHPDFIKQVKGNSVTKTTITKGLKFG